MFMNAYMKIEVYGGLGTKLYTKVGESALSS